MGIEDIKEIRGHFEDTSTDVIKKICDYLIANDPDSQPVIEEVDLEEQ